MFNENVAVFQATIFQTLPLQQVEAQVSSVSSQQNSQAVTDVIQQLLELSERGQWRHSSPHSLGDN